MTRRGLGAVRQDQLLSMSGRRRTDPRRYLDLALFLPSLAYSPLTEAEMESYIRFWESPAGQRLNAALFAAFDTVFRDVSQDLGRAAGIAMQGRDI